MKHYELKLVPQSAGTKDARPSAPRHCMSCSADLPGSGTSAGSDFLCEICLARLRNGDFHRAYAAQHSDAEV